MIKSIRLYLLVFALCLFLVLPSISLAGTIPVSPESLPVTGMAGGEGPLSSENENIPEATITVTTLEDVSEEDGYCSLREAIQAANTDSVVDECPAGVWPAADTITFSTSGLITLTSTELFVTGTGPLVIDGSSGITISGGNSMRILSLSDSAFLTLVNLSLVGGSAVEGGAIKNLSNLTVWNSTISSSQATGASTGGGGIYNTGTLKIINSTLLSNEASSGTGRGGAIYNNLGTVYLTNTTLSANHSVNDGGGIYSLGTLYIANATLSNNSAGDIGGGVYSAGYSFYLRNSIVGENTAVTDGPNCYSSNVYSQGYNLVGNTQGCGIYPITGDLTNVDPKLGPLQDNGGPTLTQALLPGSLAIDQGNPNMCIDYLGYWVDIDQRGYPRTGRCDIGAYERQPETLQGANKVYLPYVDKSCTNRLFFDDFSNPASGWKIYENQFGRYEYLNGEYRILAKWDPAWEGSLQGFKAHDYVLQVDVRNATGVNGSYGFLFEFAQDWSQFYVFVISTDGHYVIFRWEQSGAPYLANGYSGSIHTGTATNRLKLERNGSMIWAYANGDLLNIIKDGTFTDLRYVGLITIADGAPNVDARFDNFTVDSITCGRSYHYPAPDLDETEAGLEGNTSPKYWENVPPLWEIGNQPKD